MYPVIKRFIDIILSLLMIALLAPLLIFIGVLVFSQVKSSPVFVQPRGITLSKRRFSIYKFKTLYDREINGFAVSGMRLPLKNPSEEKHVIPSGRILRKSGLDELPQLFNILKGEMSFIGPRPLSVDDLLIIRRNYPSLYEEREKIDAAPGISGLWQLYKDSNFKVIDLIRLDKLYLKRRSFILDLKLMIKTIMMILRANHYDAVLFNSGSIQSMRLIKSS